MKKAAISSIIAIILGYLGTVFGTEITNCLSSVQFFQLF